MTLDRRDPTPSARDPLAWVVTALALLAFVAVLVIWRDGGATMDRVWAAQLDLRLHFSFDGLGMLYALLATGIGAAVFAYATTYLPLHLEHQDRPAREGWRFWPWMGLFCAAMVGLATAQDLILLFVMFDLTAICSYFLIGFDRQERASRLAALMALLVTGIGAVAMLIGAVMLYLEQGTFSIPELAGLLSGEAQADGASVATTVAVALIAIAALAKSAQVPLHFWLPRAMAAPTPVSAYLHSAAMVAAGVLVLGRVYQLLEGSPMVLDALLVVGLASILIGGALSLTRDGFKQVLAYSTVSQYGYVVLLYGIGGPAGAGAAAFYVVAHALAKSALFLTAGAVTKATGAKRLSEAGGLWRRMPALALVSAIAAAALSGLPLTLGFFKDELFFHAAAERSALLGALSVIAAGLTFAYTWRFWGKLFLGRPAAKTAAADSGSRIRLPVGLVAPIGVLALIAFAGGIYSAPFAELATDAAQATLGTAAEVKVAYHLDTRVENLMALAAWSLGGLLLLTPRLWGPAVRGLSRLGRRFGPSAAYEAGLVGLNRISDLIYLLEPRDLRSRIAAVLLPGALLVGFTFLFTPTHTAFSIGTISGKDPLLVALLALVAVAALTMTTVHRHLAVVLSLAVVGLGLATVYAFLGAPDVALVAVLVETVIALVFLAIVAYAPSGERPTIRERTGRSDEERRRYRISRRYRDPVIGVAAGIGAFLLVWASLSRPAATERVYDQQLRLTPDAHGLDVVTVILADFRGLDTMVEITVILVAVFGVMVLLRRERAW